MFEDPIILSVEESFGLPDDFESTFPLTVEVRDQLAALLAAKSTPEVQEISKAILTVVMNLETGLVPEVMELRNANLETRNYAREIHTRLLDLEERLLNAGMRLPESIFPRRFAPD